MSGEINQTWVVTVTRRLARHLTHQWDIQAQSRGEKVWQTPNILPWSGWLNQLWQEALDGGMVPRLLTSYQEKWLWQQAILADEGATGLLDVAATARQAVAAHALLSEWQVIPSPEALQEHPDGQAFMIWRQKVLRRCTQRGWILPVDSLATLNRVADHLPLPTTVRLVAFDQFCPLQQIWLNTLSQRGVAVEQEPFPQPAGAQWRFAARDLEGEIRAAASWARHLLESNQEARIGVVVANLAQIKSSVRRIFLQVFDGVTLLTGGSGEDTAFAISLGDPLSQWPMSRDALFLLSLFVNRSLEVGEYTTLLHSPYWRGGHGEWLARAHGDARLRRKNRRFVTLAQLAQQSDLPAGCRQTLTEVMQAIEQADGLTLPPSAWAERFHQWLTIWGWPGDKPLNSGEMQLQNAWWQLVRELGGLDDVVGVLSLQQALHHLQAMAAERLFLPESADVPVQIMGVLEAGGVTVDHLWLLGFSDEAWPPPARANPLLPARWQRHHHLPNATPEGQQEMARRHFQRLLAAAPHVVVSHGQQEGDRQIRLTPMAQTLPPLPETAHPPTYSWPRLQHLPNLEMFMDWQAPPVTDTHPASGGAGLFKSQAICPFQAFARYRLGVGALCDPQPAANPMQRGELIHWVFEEFWQLVSSKDGLLSLPEEAVQKLANKAARQGVERYVRTYPDGGQKSFQEMEVTRMQSMLCQWVELEKGRDDDFQVLNREHKETLEIGGLTVKLRPDRVDRLHQGRLAVVDYKTSLPQIGWHDERLAEPQLPLYGVLQRETVDVLSFAVAKPGMMGFRGIGKQAGEWPGVERLAEEDWQQLLDHWQSALEKMAMEFRGGVAVAAPLNATACNQCDLSRLCRIGGKESLAGEEDEPSA